MFAYIVFIATLISILVIIQYGIEKAMLWVWLPFFLVMPMSFKVNIPGLPDPNFMQAAVLPIIYILIKDRLHEFRIGRMEILLLIYCAWRITVDYLNRGYSDAQNFAFYMIATLLCPYILGKYLINRNEMDIAVARMYVFVIIFMFPLFILEFFFNFNLIWRVLNRFFPDSSIWSPTRYGFTRTTGTFTHPILACIMVVAAYRLHKWLEWMNFYKNKATGGMKLVQSITNAIPLSLSKRISVILILMALMTISRGPWIGALVGGALVAVGNTKKRWFWLKIFVLSMIFAGIFGSYAFEIYTFQRQGQVLDQQVASMLYRKELMERYLDYVFERMWTGWGLTGFPTVHGMPSIDNAWLLMSLQHGIVAPAIFTLTLTYAILSQLKYGLSLPIGHIPIGFTFAGIYLMCFVSFTTVYMGGQTEPLIFLLLGWGESIKNRQVNKIDDLIISIEPTNQTNFKKIMT